MTLLDTHIWIWWVLGVPRLGGRAAWLDAQPTDALGISVISIWEVAKLVQKGRLILPFDVRTWVDKALDETAVQVLGLSKLAVIDANALPGEFHADPADQLIVATARDLDCELMTEAARILSYQHVKAVAP